MRKLFLTALLVMTLAIPGVAMAEWQLSIYDSAGTVGYNFLGAGAVSGQQFVFDAHQQAAISATAGAALTVYSKTSDSVITSGANVAGATTLVGTTASSASAFWNTTISANDLVCKVTASSDPNDATFVCASFSSGSTVTGTVKGINGAIASGSTLYRYIPASANLYVEAPTVSKPIFVVGGTPNPVADFTVTNYSWFSAPGLSCKVSSPCVFESYSGATTTSPAAYLRGHYVKYK